MPVVPHPDTGSAKFTFKVRPGERIKDINTRRAPQSEPVSWDELERISTLQAALAEGFDPAEQPRHEDSVSVAVSDKDTSVPVMSPDRHHRRRHWGLRKESYILLALLIETCMVTADYYSPMFSARKSRVETVTVARDPNQVMLNFINSAHVPVTVRVNNHVIALDKNQSFQKSFPKGLSDISWWCEAAGKQSDKYLAQERITGDTDWEFELVFMEDKPVVLRTVLDQQSKSASPVE
ncbi:MAG: hypothetical protein RRC34_12960 [Lentisphaeria bacterium]|nr:hypothetical protein [Lentisphaeria bacterium]